MTLARYFASHTLFASAVVLFAILPPGAAQAGWCWNYSNQPANQPLPWVNTCGDVVDGEFGAGTTVGQTIRFEHRNWHCSNCIPGASSCGTPNTATNRESYGRAFLAFHRQLILDFDNYRLEFQPGLGVLDIWNPYHMAPVPGDNESTTDAFTHCSSCLPLTCGGGSIFRRAAGAICDDGCVSLPTSFTTNLANFNTLGELGYSLEVNWHGSYHNGVSSISPGCGDIAGFHYTTRDPAFWMAHKKLDEIARNWQTLQAADVVLVIDRSGSMDNNCSSTTPPPTESPCAINDARESARAFADLIADSSGHKIAVVSFASGFTNHLGLTSANGIVTDNGMNETSFESAIAGIASGGNTSIGAGIQEALSILAGGSNPHQAILVLTDGKENTPPCLVSGAAGCVGAEVAESAYGDAHVVAIGFGSGAEETSLRTVAERHGGIFIAQQNLLDAMDDLDPNKLLKFYVNAFGEIFDSAPSVDPDGVMLPGQMVSAPFPIEVCGEAEFTVFLGREVPENRLCDLQLEVFSPSGNLVARSSPLVEAGHGPRYDFVRVRLPYEGEGGGQWTARVVRPVQTSCEPQRYFYTVMMPGLGRVEPFPLKPRLSVGQELTASFRLPESFNPHNHWDEINARVVVTDPLGGSNIYPLFDDGSTGDQTAGNNTWVVQVPGAVTQPGAYHLRALFDLKRDECTTTREASYAIIAEPERQSCADFACAALIDSPAGITGQLDELACAWNACSDQDSYLISVTDTKGWLLTEDGMGGLIPADGTYPTASLAPGEHLCLGGAGGSPSDLPIYLSIPPGTQVGEKSIVRLGLSSQSREINLDCSMTLRAVPLPDCNGNGVHDSEDIETGFSDDDNRNGIPDECPDDVMFGRPAEIPSMSFSWLVGMAFTLVLIGGISLRALRRSDRSALVE